MHCIDWLVLLLLLLSGAALLEVDQSRVDLHQLSMLMVKLLVRAEILNHHNI